MSIRIEVLEDGCLCCEVYREEDGGCLTPGAIEDHFWERICRYLGNDDYIS